MSQSGKFLGALRMYAALVKFELTDEICLFYVEALEPYGLAAARAALARLARSAKVGRGLPSVDELLEVIAPAEVAKIDGADDAAVVAGRIEEALVRFGSRNAAQGYPEARAHIGELGWSVVGYRWAHLCRSTTDDDLPTLKAQWRLEVKGVLARARAMLPAAPSLPGGAHVEQLAAAQPRALPEATQAEIDGVRAAFSMDRKIGTAKAQPW